MSPTELYLFSSPDMANHPSVGTFGVAEYRAFTVGADGHFVGFEPIIVRTKATEQAKRLLDVHDVEVWNRPRLVVRLTRKPE